MDTIFHKCHGTAGWFTVVKIARDEPRRYGKNGELLIAYDETDEHHQRQASMVSGTDMGRAAAKMVDQEKGYSRELE